MGASKIPWTDWVVEVTGGCTKCSPGCDNCYAIDFTDNRLSHIDRFGGLIENGEWTGEIRLYEEGIQEILSLRNKPPMRVFINSRSDLFHPGVPFEWVDKVFAARALCPQHTFQVLTKRPERRKDYFDILNQRVFEWDNGEAETEEYLITQLLEDDCCPNVENACHSWLNMWNARHLGWPLPNVWLGVTAENQEMWDKRKDDFLNTPAAKHFVSNEPLLSEIKYTDEDLQKLDWVIIGAESGAGRRFCFIKYITNLVEQCTAAGVPVFVKQIHDGTKLNIRLNSKLETWPSMLQLQQWPK